jgi:hypothetical protein
MTRRVRHPVLDALGIYTVITLMRRHARRHPEHTHRLRAAVLWTVATVAALVIFRHELLLVILAAPSLAYWRGRCARTTTARPAEPREVAELDQLAAENAYLHRQLDAAQLEAATLIGGLQAQVRDLKGQLAAAPKPPTVPTEAELRAQLRARANQISTVETP